MRMVLLTRSWFVQCIGVLTVGYHTSVALAFALGARSRNAMCMTRRVQLSRKYTSNSNNEEPDAWLDRAAQLRKEVQELEAVATSRRSTNDNRAPYSSVNTAQYTDVSDSIWSLSYRFSDQPESDMKPDERRQFFGGRITVKFRPDGYTDIISQESYGSVTESCIISKVWGWDVELSKDKESDGVEKEYLLFSADVVLELPTSTTTPSKQRIYFQARQEKVKSSGTLSLVDGTITIKQDLVKNDTRWGLFSPVGILAQFRYVGDFIAKPTAITDQS